MFIAPKDQRPQGSSWDVPLEEGWHEATIEDNDEGVSKKGDPKIVIRFCCVNADGQKAKVESHLPVGSNSFNAFLDSIGFDQGGELEKGSLVGTVLWVRTVNVAGEREGKVFINIKEFSGQQPG